MATSGKIYIGYYCYCEQVLFWPSHKNIIPIRATMMERSYKNIMMKCNSFVQVVILNIEYFNLFVRCILLLH